MDSGGIGGSSTTSCTFPGRDEGERSRRWRPDGTLWRPVAHSCFAVGTKVWTLTGLRPIEQIKPGDRVLSQDVETGELQYKPVVMATVRPTNRIMKIDLGERKRLPARRAIRCGLSAADGEWPGNWRPASGCTPFRAAGRSGKSRNGNPTKPRRNTPTISSSPTSTPISSAKRGILVHDNTSHQARPPPCFPASSRFQVLRGHQRTTTEEKEYSPCSHALRGNRLPATLCVARFDAERRGKRVPTQSVGTRDPAVCGSLRYGKRLGRRSTLTTALGAVEAEERLHLRPEFFEKLALAVVEGRILDLGHFFHRLIGAMMFDRQDLRKFQPHRRPRFEDNAPGTPT